jgi:hypothetical protein
VTACVPSKKTISFPSCTSSEEDSSGMIQSSRELPNISQSLKLAICGPCKVNKFTISY